MVLDTLLETKREIFGRPETIREVVGNRGIIKVGDFFDIVDALANRSEEEAVQLEGVTIIPPGFYSAQNFSKRGKVITLNTYGGNPKRLREEKQSELKARIAASESNKRENGPYIGFMWVDPEKNRHLVRPTISIEGHRLFQYAQKAQGIQEKIRIYSAQGAPWNNISVKVPSRSEDIVHEVVLEHIPKVKGDSKYIEWTRVSSRHDCGFKRHDHTFRFDRIIRYCPHDVAAYVAYSKKALKATGVMIPQIFPMFTEPLLRLFNSAANRTFITEEYRDQGKMRHRSRPLSMPEIDAIIMDAWLLHGNKQTFFVRDTKKEYGTGLPVERRKRMRDYEWFSRDLPGLPFGNE